MMRYDNNNRVYFWALHMHDEVCWDSSWVLLSITYVWWGIIILIVCTFEVTYVWWGMMILIVSTLDSTCVSDSQTILVMSDNANHTHTHTHTHTHQEYTNDCLQCNRLDLLTPNTHLISNELSCPHRIARRNNCMIFDPMLFYTFLATAVHLLAQCAPNTLVEILKSQLAIQFTMWQDCRVGFWEILPVGKTSQIVERLPGRILKSQFAKPSDTSNDCKENFWELLPGMTIDCSDVECRPRTCRACIDICIYI